MRHLNRRLLSLLTAAALALTLPGCSTAQDTTDTAAELATEILLSDDGITVNGQTASDDSSSAVYVGADIVYYESGHDETYGEGTEADAHSADEAEQHTVVTITEPGMYRLSGQLSTGQVAVDLGEDAEDDPNAVVTLVLDGVDITCTVAPAVIFYHVYECGSTDAETASGTVDTSAAGANVYLADGSENIVNGSYVARIYEEGTTDKLHKYDGAFYSKMSMNIDGEGSLVINAENEGLDTELHLTINGGNISITAQNDGINTNEDGVSVTTVNGGNLTINAGLGAEGDGIDSNGFLTINGGTIVTMANEQSPEGGIDADGDITINGGTLIALGVRNDSVSEQSEQLYMELSMSSVCPESSEVVVADPDGNEIFSFAAQKSFQSLTLSSPDFMLDTAYTVTIDGVQQQYTGTGTFGGGWMPMSGQERPNRDGESSPPDGEPNGQRPDALPNEDQPTPPGEQPNSPNEQITPPDGEQADRPSSPPDGQRSERDEQSAPTDNEEERQGSDTFTLTETQKSFSGVSPTAA